MFDGRNCMGQAYQPDDLLFGAPLSCVMVSVVSPGVEVIGDVACLTPPLRASCYDVFDVSITALCWEAMLSEAAGNSLLLAAQEAPSVLLGAAIGQVFVNWARGV